MVWKALVTFFFLVAVVAATACAHTGRRTIVDVRVLSDNGAEFAKYMTYPRLRQDASYFYVEAIKGQRYAVQVTNRSNSRIGIVIAVDGRNIIDGARSDLKKREQMYILAPHETNTFEGWRTGIDRTNRFYFTEQPDSYAEKVFSDASAMGTIALAVYREKLPEPVRMREKPSQKDQAAAGTAAPAPIESRPSRTFEKKNEEAGTGFGETAYSPVRCVKFDPEPTASEKIVMKYEWHSELCRKGIIPCEPENRFWPDAHRFAPIPDDFKG